MPATVSTQKARRSKRLTPVELVGPFTEGEFQPVPHALVRCVLLDDTSLEKLPRHRGKHTHYESDLDNAALSFVDVDLFNPSNVTELRREDVVLLEHILDACGAGRQMNNA